MKRVLSIILALSMALSLMSGVAFASGEAATDRTYTLAKPSVLDDAYWDSDHAIQGSILPLKGFGNHGFYYLDADEETLLNVEEHVSALQLAASYFRLYSVNGNNFSHTDGAKLALALEKPCDVPSFYSVTLNIGNSSNNTATAAEVYMDYLDITSEAAIDVENYTIPENQIGDTYNIKNLYTTEKCDLKELIYSDGEKNFSISLYTGKGGNLRLTGLTLTHETVESIAFSDEAISLEEVNDTANVSVEATISGGKTMGVVDSFVTYESSNPSVVTVADDGTITAKGTGMATITASVGDKTAEAQVVVGDKVYAFNRDVANASINQESGVPFVGSYTNFTDNQPWVYFDINDAANGNATVASLQKDPDRLRMFIFNDNTVDFRENGVQLAFKLKTPAAGLYKVSGEIMHDSYGIKNVSWYMDAYAGESTNSDVADYTKPEMLLKTGIDSSTSAGSDKEVKSVETGKLISSDGTNNLIFTIDTGSVGIYTTQRRFNLASIKLTPVTVNEIELAASEEMLDIGGKATLAVRAGECEFVNSFVEYEVTEGAEYIKVDADGTVTAKATGTAKIKATAGGFEDTVTITVSDKISAPTEIYYVKNDNIGGAGAVKSTKPGTPITFTAEEKEGYTFRYWMLGSAATGRYYSSDVTVTVKPYANISLTAIYTEDSDSTKVVDLFNYNGEFLQSLTNLDELETVKPTMIGHTFANKWLLADKSELTTTTELIAPVTQAVAQYTKNSGYEAENVNNNSAYGWTRNGKLVTYAENYTFFTWLNTVGTIAKSTEEVTDKIPLVVLEESDGAYMIEYDKGEYEIVEAGILFGKTGTPSVSSAYSKAKVKDIKAHGQFTAKPEDDEAYALGYVIYKDAANKTRVIYSE